MPKLEIPLALPEVRVLKTETDQRQIVITAESTREWAICHKCGQEIREFHSCNRLLRDPIQKFQPADFIAIRHGLAGA